MIHIFSSRTRKARWTSVVIGNLLSNKSTASRRYGGWRTGSRRFGGWRTGADGKSGSATSFDAGPLESEAAAPAVESFSNFAPDSERNEPFLTLGKNTLQNSKLVARIFLFCFPKQLSWKKKLQISSLMTVCHVGRDLPLHHAVSARTWWNRRHRNWTYWTPQWQPTGSPPFHPLWHFAASAAGV